MNRRLRAKSKAKLRAGSGSWQVMNSAQEPKLLAMNRRLTAKSKAKLRMGSGSWQVMNSAQEPKLLSEFRTHFDKKKEENAVEDSLTELNVQLEDTTSEKKTCEPEKCVNKVCRVCLKVGHWTCECSYLRRVPAGVTEVGKGYVIVCLRCPSVRNRCKHNIGRAVYVYCYICKVWGQHVTLECSKIPRRTKDDTKENALILYL